MKRLRLLFPILANFAVGASVYLASKLFGGYFEEFGAKLPVPTAFYISYPYCGYSVALIYCIIALLIDRKASEDAKLLVGDVGWFFAVTMLLFALIALALPFARGGTVISG